MRKTIQSFKPVMEALSEENIGLISNFFVEEKAFDNFIKEEAINDMISGDGVTYLIINEANEREIVAYYTISSSSIHTIDRYDFEDEDVPQDEKREHFSPISAFLIKMFAVNEKYQDTYYNNELVASLILKNIISDLHDMSTSVVGAKIIILCAVEKAEKFYNLNKFKKFDDNYTLFDKIDAQDNCPMYLALHNV